MILLIDNYDSFTYNIYQYVASINSNILVKRNDQINLEQIYDLKPSHIILSPGPKLPPQAGICLNLIKEFYDKTPLFGICLGHQAIVMALGGKLKLNEPVMHGKTSTIFHSDSLLFKNIPGKFTATRYHSIIASEIPASLNIIAHDSLNIVMAVEHNNYPIYGCQYHPESILTEFGEQHFQNFLSI